MKIQKLLLVVGARPNFMKVAPLVYAIKAANRASGTFSPVFQYTLLHTGQHYDYEMSEAFFEDLEIPKPDIYLGVGSGTHTEQTAKIMLKLEGVMIERKPDLVMVFGDVNSTVAAAFVSAKLLVPLAHVEAGLRSFDRKMPEEINRIVTDRLSDYLFTTEPSANENLKQEGIPESKIFYVGNVMIDTLLCYREKARQSQILKQLGLREKSYALLTLHRPSNVDVAKTLIEIFQALYEISREVTIVFPIHPRTRKKLETFKLFEVFRGLFQEPPAKTGIILISPQKYIDFLALEEHAIFILTDSGGIQEETTILEVPCLTLRENTERPVTVEMGTNVIVGTNRYRILQEARKVLKGDKSQGRVPPLWDGKAAERIIRVLLDAKSYGPNYL